jgi:hypothetical protein
MEEETGSNGTEYTLDFIGRNQFANMNDTIKFITPNNSTSDFIREKMTEKINLCLVRYILKTNYSDSLKLKKPTIVEDEKEADTLIDPWDLWVFSMSMNSYFSGEKSSKNMNLYSNVSAGRVTKDWKFNIGSSFNYSDSKYDYEDIHSRNLSRSKYAYSGLIKTISDRWSLGSWLDWSQATYSNIKNSYSVASGVEYNFMDFEDYVRKSIRLRYKLSAGKTYYQEETIFLKNQETLLSERISLVSSFKQPWGNTYLSIAYSNYMHDFSKNRIELYSNLSVNVYKGLNVDFSISFDSIHDQLSLPKGDASVEDVLLRRKMLGTQYSYWGSFGLSYTFGSMYSNIVNPRFD